MKRLVCIVLTFVMVFSSLFSVTALTEMNQFEKNMASGKTVNIAEGKTILYGGAFSKERAKDIETLIFPDSLNTFRPAEYDFENDDGSRTGVYCDDFLRQDYFVSLKEIAVSEDNPYFTSVDGVLYTKDKKVLVYYPCNKDEWNYTVDPSCEIIDDRAFYKTKVLYVDLNNVKHIGWQAFSGSSLISISNYDKLEYIGKEAFYQTSLEDFDFILPENLKYIGIRAFAGQLKSFVNNKNAKYMTVLDGVLYNKDKTALLCYPAYRQGDTFIIPGGVKFIGVNTTTEGIYKEKYDIYQEFRKGLSLSYFDVTEYEEKYEINHTAPFSHSRLKKIVFGNDVVEIGYNAFEYSKSLSSVSLNKDLKKIGYLSFLCCSSLENITIPKNVAFIDGETFALCEALESVNVEEGSGSFKVIQGVLLSKNSEVIYLIPEKSKGYRILSDTKYVCDERSCYKIPGIKMTVSDGYAAYSSNSHPDKVYPALIQKEPDVTPEPTDEITYEICSIEDMKDIPKTHFAYKAIEKCLEEGIMHGKGDGIFEPDSNITRAEFAQLIYNYYRGNEKLNPLCEVSFEDVDGQWFEKAVITCAKAGVIKGFDGKFDPYSNIKREDAVLMFARIIFGENSIEKTDVKISLEKLKDYGKTFNDVDSISDYAEKAVIKSLGIFINGDDKGNINPKENMTRAECAQMIYNIFYDR